MFTFVYSDISALMANDGTETVKSNYPSLGLGNSFAFKFEDLKGRMHRLNFGELCKMGREKKEKNRKNKKIKRRRIKTLK